MGLPRTPLIESAEKNDFADSGGLPGGSTGVSKLSSGVHIGREFASFSAKLKPIDVKSSVDSSVNSF